MSNHPPIAPAARATLVQFRIRETGEIVSEPIFSEGLLRWFYENPVGSLVFRRLVNNKSFCDWYGRRMDHPSSRGRIAPFVAQFGIDMTEAELPIADYANFNAFFERRLAPGRRTWPTEPGVLGSPGDGKLLVYPRLEDDVRLPIKGLAVSPAGLLASEEAARPFRGGAAMVLRLAPYDYHRFHFPDEGDAGPAHEVPGAYHSVNPIALARIPDLFCRNKRMVSFLDSRHFGRVASIEVGAITVGTIIQTHVPGPVARGQEKGKFRYGGSTVVVLFEPETIAFDGDLIADSAAGLEVRVKAGMHLGRRDFPSLR